MKEFEQSSRPYEDSIQGVFYDNQNNPFFVFVRTAISGLGHFHLLAIRANGDVLIIQKVTIKGIFKKHFVVTMEGQDGRMIEAVPCEILDFGDVPIEKYFAVVSSRTRALGPDHLQKNFWEPVDLLQIQEWSDNLLKHSKKGV